MSHHIRSAAVIAVFATIVFGVAAPTDAARRKAFDVADTAWPMTTRTRVLAVAPGIGTGRSEPTYIAAGLAFDASGRFALLDQVETYNGNWTQRGRKVTLEFDPEFLQDLQNSCDLIPGACVFSKVKGSVTATTKRGFERVKLRIRARGKTRYRGVLVRFVAKIKGTSEQPE